MLCGSKSLLLSVIEAEIACTLCHITTTLTMLRCRDAENWVSWGSCQGVVAVVGAAVAAAAARYLLLLLLLLLCCSVVALHLL